MRIVGGRLGGQRLAAPGADGGGAAHLRPTSDRVREALFNRIHHGPYPPIEGARVLDLFAGTGALGLEAVSRGAVRAVFVDDFPKARALIRENVERLGLTGATKIWRRDATRLGPCRDAPYTLVFLDPPYGSDLGQRAFASAVEGGWLAPGALVVWESPASEAAPAPEGATIADSRAYGESRITLLEMP